MPEPAARERRAPSLRERRHRERAQLWTAALLLAAAGAGLGFVALFIAGASNQWLGVSLGAALALLAAALVLASRELVPQEVAVQPRETFGAGEPPAELAPQGEPLTRRRLLFAAAAAAGVALTAAAAAPLASLGPAAAGRIGDNPWRAGVRLIGMSGAPLTAADVNLGAFATAFAEGADRDHPLAAVVVAHIPPDSIDPGRAAMAVGGVVAFSRVCTHAGCAVSLFRSPLYEQTSDRPALVCPCHYSTFDPARGGKVLFGPAGRPLPQLPLTTGADGALVAAGPLDGPAGPAWWGMRRT